jgi:hypothetical protein
MLHAYVLRCEDIYVNYFFLLNCGHIYCICLILLFDLAPTDDPLIPINLVGIDLNIKLDSS